MTKKNPFRKRNTPAQPEEPRPKPATELTDSELEEALRKARREILALQHEELRIREKTRMFPGDAPEGSGKPRSLGEIFSKSKRGRFK
jgi:hypothetical protein